VRRRVAHDSRPWTATRVQLPTLVQIGGSQPTLSAVLATRGVERFAKRKSASRTSSFFLVNPSFFSTSQIERVGWRRLWTRGFGASQGQSWGQFHHATYPGSAAAIRLSTQCPYSRPFKPPIRARLSARPMKRIVSSTSLACWRQAFDGIPIGSGNSRCKTWKASVPLCSRWQTFMRRAGAIASCTRAVGAGRPSSVTSKDATSRPLGPRRPYSSVLLSRMSHVTTSTPCASASFRSCATSASAMHFDSSASNAASSARSLSPPIAARCLS